jgi:predicted RNA binding protein YcfA (HicA-like mRNA interferase family)
MTHAQKLFEKMRNNPRDWRIQQLEIIAKRYGISVRKTGGSHIVFDHPKWVELLCIPAHRPIKPIYIRKLLALIETLGDNL